MNILFLCTGNYYRSRFAEILLDQMLNASSFSGTIDSAGLAIERGIHNIGSLSEFAKKGLWERGYTANDRWFRFPRSVMREDFDRFDRIIALDESEHRPLMVERFPQSINRVEFWQVHDIDQTRPAVALSAIAEAVCELAIPLSAGIKSRPIQ